MRWFALVIGWSLLPAGLVAGGGQPQLLYTLESPNPNTLGQFGASVSGAGDVNNDGCLDMMVGAPHENPGASPWWAGSAYLVCGGTGVVLDTLLSPNQESSSRFGLSVSSLGDVNNDAHDDVIVGACLEHSGGQSSGRAYILSGDGGGPLHTLESPSPAGLGGFGYSVSGVADLNDDGCPDVVIGAFGEHGGATGAGRVYIFSGSGGDLLYTLESPAPEPDGLFGVAVSDAGDVNSDGYGDVVVGAYAEGGTTEAGRAYVFSGLAGDLLYTLESANPDTFGQFGVSVSGAGDVNGDGHDDVIVGATGEDGGAADAGRAYVFSGDGGLLLHTLESPSPDAFGCFGYAVSGVGDVNNDLCDDVAVGAFREACGTPDAGRAYVFGGQEGGLLCVLESPNPEPGGHFGISVSGGEDVNIDGYLEVVVGASWEDGAGEEDAGRAYVFTLGPLTAAPDDAAVAPLGPVIRGPFPNPTAGQVRLAVHVSGELSCGAKLTLHDVAGRVVATPLHGTVRRGEDLRVNWTAGADVAPGLYWWHLKAGAVVLQKPMVLVR
jgi:hypothetical protein